jgi:hypothetical protein
MGPNGDLKPILDVWHRRPDGGTLDWSGLRRRRRCRRVEVAPEISLPDPSGMTRPPGGVVFFGDQAIILRKMGLHA